MRAPDSPGSLPCTPDSSNEAACRYAIALAQQENLRLLGLSVIDPSRVISAEMMPPGGGAYKAMKDDALHASLRLQDVMPTKAGIQGPVQ